MNSIEICIPFIVGIFAVAYPILFQVISNLGEKYDSILLVSIFKQEYEYKIFKLLLYITLGAVFIYIIAGITRIVDVKWLLEQSEILIIIFTFTLIVSFFLFVRKILIYYNRNDLTSYFINKDKRIDTSNYDEYDFVYFESISELLYWSIKNQDEDIAKTISNYFYTCFREFRKLPTYTETGYPDKYYTVVYKATIELLRVNDNKLIFLESRIPGGLWLLGEFVDNKISEKTYSYLWLDLRSCVKYKRDNIVLEYWRNAFQYFSYSLRSIDPVYSDDYQSILNELEIEEREKERMRFLEFNYALGGLLLFEKRYNCIHRIFRYTQSDPPSYNLFPKSMTEIFHLFFSLYDSFKNENSWITFRYSFPDIEGIDANEIIRNWIRKYVAILFLRQYTLLTYYINQQHVVIPELPKKKRERHFWLTHIDYFKDTVLNLRSDEELMNGLSFNFYGNISDGWCENNHKILPRMLFEETKKKLIQSIQRTEIEQEISLVKVEKFKTSTKEIITNVFNAFKKVMSSCEINENYNSLYSQGIQTITDKSSFADDQEAEHLNYDTFLAESYVETLNYSISQQYFFKVSNKYLFDSKELFRAVDYLKIKNPDDYIIIAFGLYLPYFIETEGVNIIDNKYKGIDIYEIKSSFSPLNQSLVVMKKDDLPYCRHLDMNPEIEKKYELNMVDKDIKLYVSILDLHKREDLWGELTIKEGINPSTQVLLKIELPIEFRWKNDIEVVQIKLYSIYKGEGILNKLKDIRPFTN